MSHLIGADEVAIYLVDDAAGTVEPFPGWAARAPMSLERRAFLLDTADSYSAPSAAPAWLDEPGSGGSATLAVAISRRHGTTAVLTASFCHPGAAARTRATRLMPDLVTLIGEHVQVHDRLRSLEAENAAAAAALDHGECAVIAVAADGEPVYVNAAAQRFLAEGDGLQLRRGAVRPTDYAGAVRFRAALEEVADGAGGPLPGGRPRAMVMLLPRRDGGRPSVLAITPARGRDGRRGRAAAILYILEAGQPAPNRMAAVCRLHGLSRVETSLISHLIAGLTLTEAAVEMRVKPETVRAYLKQVFAKTGTHRQVDLVALMSRYGRAIRGDFDFRPA